jgi:hypothetical protein
MPRGDAKRMLRGRQLGAKGGAKALGNLPLFSSRYLLALTYSPIAFFDTLGRRKSTRDSQSKKPTASVGHRALKPFKRTEQRLSAQLRPAVIAAFPLAGKERPLNVSSKGSLLSLRSLLSPFEIL